MRTSTRNKKEVVAKEITFLKKQFYTLLVNNNNNL